MPFRTGPRRTGRPRIDGGNHADGDAGFGGARRGEKRLDVTGSSSESWSMVRM